MAILFLFASCFLSSTLIAGVGIEGSGWATRVFHVVDEPEFCFCEFNTPPDDGPWGVSYIGAPCQRFTGNELLPWCWKEPEDNCGTIASMNLYYSDGAECGPCQFRIAVEAVFPEPCNNWGWGCAGPCCATNEWVNYAGESSSSGDTLFDKVFSVPCGTEETDIMMVIQCTWTILTVTGPTYQLRIRGRLLRVLLAGPEPPMPWRLPIVQMRQLMDCHTIKRPPSEGVVWECPGERSPGVLCRPDSGKHHAAIKSSD